MNLTLTDPTYSEKEKINFFDAFFLKLLNNKRDLPFIYLSLKITFVIVPFALYLFLNKNVHWAFYLVYLALIFISFLGPFILMLHNTCHRKLFKKEYSYLTKYIHWFLGCFFGQTPETYFYHHIAMHHAENNLLEDLSSTMKYRRDSVRGFLQYLLSFYFFGVIHLSFYFSKKDRNKFAWKVLAGECAYIALVILLAFYNFKATLVVYILPLIFTRFAMMAGNWAQHAFIDPQNPDNIYKNSITCINTIYNKKCFNDGYHIGHHLRPALHWTEMPSNFLQNIEEYKNNEVVIFSGLDYFQIWFLLMTKNYKFLSKKFVSLSDKFTSEKDKIAFLKSRTKTIITGV
ncbi:fatty acid desaturase family protein [Segetibacter koreensis]|uniref:fatty acid desaturase family protein n=1 Tax=Segetibacter koreensis TaxID=398037 RepID=UPI00035F0826|nr:fatty acid desaturase [Segetibacter koreensis]